MQIHYFLQQDCELKMSGPSAFTRAMATYALVRDLEAGVPAFPQEGRDLVVKTLQDNPDNIGDVEIWMPPFTRRKKDPENGLIVGDVLMKRVNKILEKGVICQSCPAAATNPQRFGCWGTLTLPLADDAANGILQLWEAGVARLGKSRVTRWYESDADWKKRERQLKTDETPSRFIEWDNKGVKKKLNIDAVFHQLEMYVSLDAKAISELLADFGAVAWDQLKELFKSFKAFAASDPFNKVVHPDPMIGPAPFLLQPREDDPHGVREWKTFLYACYWAMCLGQEINLVPVTLDNTMEDV